MCDSRNSIAKMLALKISSCVFMWQKVIFVLAKVIEYQIAKKNIL